MPSQPRSVFDMDDTGMSELVALGRTVSTARAQGEQAVPHGSEDLIRVAREYLACISPQQLSLGNIPVLLADYRRLARCGWALALASQGSEALGRDKLPLLGRFMHFKADDLRMGDIGPLLTEYAALVEMDDGRAAQRSLQRTTA
jgi:hypothetical protein